MEESVGAAASGQIMGGSKSLCYREKNWDELTDSEKIERMRQMVKNLQHQNSRLERNLHALHQHQHAADGDILVPLHCTGNDGPEYIRDRQGEYF